MNIKRIIYSVINIALPSILFMALYKNFNLIIAVLLTLAYEVIDNLITFHRFKKCKNTKIMGVIGTLLMFISISVSSYEKLYFIPAILQNMLLAIFSLALCFQSKSIFLYIVKDFEFPGLVNLKDHDLLPLNYIWLAYFAIKIVSKILGMIFLDFTSLYWLVFVLGEPLNILTIVVSIIYIRKSKCKSNKRV